MKSIEIQNLDKHLKPLQIGGISTPIEIATEEIRISKKTEFSNDVMVGSDLYLNGTNTSIFFSQGMEIDTNTTTNEIGFKSQYLHVNSNQFGEERASEDMESGIVLNASAGYDSWITFRHALTGAWRIGNDATDNVFKIESGNATLGTDPDLQLDASGNTKQNGSISIKEKASAIADTDTYGQIWVKNEDPEELCFTDGGGTDIVGIGKYHYDTKVTNFYSTATANYLPLSGGVMETTSTLGKTENVCMVAPFNGTLERAVFRSEIAQNGDLIFAIHESSDGTEAPALGAVGSKTTAINIADDTAQVVDFDSMTSGSNVITKGRIYAIKLTTPSGPQDTNVSLVFKWDITS